MTTPTHTDFCTAHLVEENLPGEPPTEVCRTTVTVGAHTITVETSPDWPAHHTPIVPPDLTDLTPSSARDLAAALNAAARLIDGQGPATVRRNCEGEGWGK